MDTVDSPGHILLIVDVCGLGVENLTGGKKKCVYYCDACV